MLVEIEGRKVKEYGYPECSCGRSSRWYSGITKTSTWFDKDLQEEFTTSKFTCIFCQSSTEEGSDRAVAIYGNQLGGKHYFFKDIALIKKGEKDEM